MGRHVWFRTPTKQDRKDIFDLYLSKVAHDPELDTPQRRDEIARITNGYSPAMIDQVCSMALTIAQHDGRDRFAWERPRRGDDDDRVGHRDRRSSTSPEETRAVAIHEAGHAAAAHVFMKGAESTRLSISMRGGSLGHHQALEKEERFSRWPQRRDGAGSSGRSARWPPSASSTARTRTASAATSSQRDARAAWMVGASAMGPEPFDLNGRRATTRATTRRGSGVAEALREDRAPDHEPDERRWPDRPRTRSPASSATATSARSPRRSSARPTSSAYNLSLHNKDAVEKIADELVERREVFGDELVEILDGVNLKKPEIDYAKEDAWPTM